MSLTELIEITRDALRGDLETTVQALLNEAFPEGSSTDGDYYARQPRVYLSSGYRLMQNKTHFLDVDGAWKTFVYRGSMYAELAERSWPNRMLELAGGVV